MAQIKSNWTAPTFSFDAADQPTAWEDFYIRALDYLETLRIKPDVEDREMKGWTEIKMMFTGEDRRALQTLIDNDTITEADQRTPRLALKAIQTAIKEGEHYWHYRDEVLSDIRQQPEEQVHTLSNRIINLINNCNFQDQQTAETLKIMLLQHTIKYHEARNWIRLQDPTTLTYKTLLQHCKQLEQRCEQFKKARLKGRAELTTLANASVTQTSIHQDAITKHSSYNSCYRCGYSHVNRDCPARGQRCFKCNRLGHFSHLCKARNTNSHTNSYRHDTRRPSYRRQNSRSSSRSSSRSPSRSSTHQRHPRRHRSPTPYHVDTVTITRPNTAPTNSDTEDSSSQHYEYLPKRNKCKNRAPTPLPPSTYSDIDTNNAESEMSFSIYSQEEGNLSTDRTTPETFYIPMTSHDEHQTTLPRPSRIPVSNTKYTTKFQHKDKPTTQNIKSSPRPSCIPVFNNNRHNLTPHTTPPEVQPSISSLTRPSEETIIKQPTPTVKSPLLPTPLAHNRQSTSPRSTTSNSSRNSTFSRPSTVISRPQPRNNYRFHQNSYISRPHTPEFNTQRPPLLPRPPYQCQNIMTGPYQQHQQTQGHFFTRPYQQQQPHGHFPQPVYNIHISLPYYTA